MRIDSNQGLQSLVQNERGTAQNPAGGVTASAKGDPLGNDQAQISAVHTQAQALAVQVLQFPEVRQEKVNALRQLVAAGAYQPGTKQVADALFAHLLATPAA